MSKFVTDEFNIEYTESNIEKPVLWENHCHAQFEMIAVVEGDISVFLEGQSYRLKKNQIIIISPLCYHAVTANEKGIYRRITALFGLDLIPKVLQEEFVKNERKARFTCSQKVEKIKEIYQSGKVEFYAPLLKSLMTEIFYDAISSPQSANEPQADEFLQTTLQYIDQHLQEKILLEDLVKYTARSKSSFCHLFKKKMNVSPKQYIIQKKLAYAGKLIDEGVPYTVVAMQIGYENYSDFYRLYKKNLKK